MHKRKEIEFEELHWDIVSGAFSEKQINFCPAHLDEFVDWMTRNPGMLEKKIPPSGLMTEAEIETPINILGLLRKKVNERIELYKKIDEKLDLLNK